MNKRVLLVVNPKSGNKQGLRQAQHIAEVLKGHGYTCEVEVSLTTQDLPRILSQKPLAQYHLAGIVGGDGSMHEWVNAVLTAYDTCPIPIALFPCGTGNAFNVDIGCNTIQQTIDCILAGSISAIDVAKVEYPQSTCWSFNILGCGLVADINRMAENMRWLGGMRYNVASVIQLLRNRTYPLQITVGDQHTEGVYSFVLACNTRYTGKGMMMAPRAALNDGKFDVLMVKASSRLTLLKLFPKIFKGQHLSAPILEYHQCSELSVHCTSAGIASNIDGEMKGSTPFTMRVYPNKIKVFVKPIRST
jgi:diacylglycerol kinase (ATP)